MILRRTQEITAIRCRNCNSLINLRYGTPCCSDHRCATIYYPDKTKISVKGSELILTIEV